MLAWFLAGSTMVGNPVTTVHATVPAEGLTTEVFAWELGRQLGYGPTSPDLLLNRVALDRRSLFLLIPDLHRSGRGPADLPQSQPATLSEDLIRHLLALPHVRAAVEVGESGLLADLEAEVLPVTHTGELRPAADEPAGWTEISAAVPRTPAGGPDWTRAPEPLRDQALDQALREASGHPAPQVVHLLSDPGYLVYGPARAITAAVADERIPLPEGGRAIWQRAAPQLTATGRDDTERAALLHAAALGTNDRLAEYLRPLAQQNAWTAAWARRGFPVAALGMLRTDGHDLLAADALGRLAVYGPEGRAAPAAVTAPARLRPHSIAVRDGEALLALDDSGALHVLEATETETTHVLAHIAGHHGAAVLTPQESAVATAIGGSPDGGYAAVGDSAGDVHLWPLRTYRPEPQSSNLHQGRVLATACLPLPDSGLTLVFSAGIDGTVRLWETSTSPMPKPVDQRPALVTALAATDTPAGPLLAVAWNDSELHIWHVFSGNVQVLPLMQTVNALAFTSDGLLVTGGPEGLYAFRVDPAEF